MNNNKGGMVLITILVICTLLVAVAGATFSYFNVTMNGAESGTTIEVTSGTLSIEYDGDSEIKAENVNLGENIGSKNFVVTGVVTGSSNLNYEADLVVTNNTYSDDALVYTLTSVNTSNNGNVILSTSEPVAIKSGASTIILGNGSFAGPTSTGSQHNYSISIKYANQDQTNDAIENFEAKLSVLQTKK